MGRDLVVVDVVNVVAKYVQKGLFWILLAWNITCKFHWVITEYGTTEIQEVHFIISSTKLL